MGANHAHGTAVPSSRRTVVAGLAVLVPLAVITLAGLLWLWPQGQDAPAQSGVERLYGTVTSVTLSRCPAATEGSPQPDPATCGNATVKLKDGPDTGKDVTLRLPSGPGAQRFGVNDSVILLRDGDGAYQISDHDRAMPLWLFGAAFALAVIAFGRWRGVTALVGLAVTFVLLLTFVLPGILEGRSPMLVAIVGAAAIMLTVLYLTHGFSLSTSMAVLGTMASLMVTGLLSYAALGFARLNGVTDDSALMLGMSLSIDTQGLLLASIIIGALGVLDDVTVTQAVTVAELARANPSYGFRRLYRAASRIGRAHIASVINTIILAYAGASLPLLLLFSIGAQPLGEVLTTPVIAQEIVRSIVGTLGLIAAVPITTALAALTASRRHHTDHSGGEEEVRHEDDEDFFAPNTDHDDFFSPTAPPPSRDAIEAARPHRDPVGPGHPARDDLAAARPARGEGRGAARPARGEDRGAARPAWEERAAVPRGREETPRRQGGSPQTPPGGFFTPQARQDEPARPDPAPDRPARHRRRRTGP